MEWIVNLDFGRFRTQGILGVGATILMSTAKDLGLKGRDPLFGAGLVDPLKALEYTPRASTGAAPTSAAPPGASVAVR
jgi:hypothetical protein